jgi:hypothetical protein
MKMIVIGIEDWRLLELHVTSTSTSTSNIYSQCIIDRVIDL